MVRTEVGTQHHALVLSAYEFRNFDLGQSVGPVCEHLLNIVGFKGQPFLCWKAAVSAYKFAACVGAMLGITVAVALAYPSAETNDVKIPKAAKLEVLRKPRDLGCPKVAWPSGCEWRPRVISPVRRAQRLRHYRSLF